MNISGYPAHPSGHSSPSQVYGPSPGCRVNKGLLLNHSLRIALQRYILFVKLYKKYKENQFL